MNHHYYLYWLVRIMNSEYSFAFWNLSPEFSIVKLSFNPSLKSPNCQFRSSRAGKTLKWAASCLFVLQKLKRGNLSPPPSQTAQRGWHKIGWAEKNKLVQRENWSLKLKRMFHSLLSDIRIKKCRFEANFHLLVNWLSVSNWIQMRSRKFTPLTQNGSFQKPKPLKAVYIIFNL